MTHFIIRYTAALISLIIVMGTGVSADQLSDDEKKSTVYSMYTEYKKAFPAVSDISPQDAMILADSENAVFVDIREPAEINVSKIPRAITREAFLKDASAHSDKTVITYCTISYRSGVFADEMAGRGITVINLQGGILAWTLAGGVVVDPDGQPVRRLHVYGKRWNLPPSGYTVKMFGWIDRIF